MNYTTQTFPRRMGERVRGAEYASAIHGPRPGRIRNGLCWIAALCLLAGAASLPYFW